MRNYSLPKARRLHRAAEFQSVIRFKRSVSGQFLQFFIKPSPLDYPRLGLIVAKKLERQAVKRNRLKRVLREIFRIHQQELDKVDCVFRLQRSTTQADIVRFRQEAEMLIFRMKRHVTIDHKTD
ncbi:ribonuclease P protein component [Nitrosomonas sp.]|uniref:ribonuclease P protein component n=1 Tax=Nitrosomonas sp. TaxID=42353 RepID=UPI00260186FB|nr:ribonuclease P protein component [Nitrosomonas sp.]MCW5601143.1 ribonuclease P protein component [Nitrosomonas sp.]